MKKLFITLIFALAASASMAQAPAKVDTIKINLVAQDKELIIKWLDDATNLIGKSDAPIKEANPIMQQLQMIKNLIVEQSNKYLATKGKPKK